MDQGDIIRKHLTGTPSERRRREELLQALLCAFTQGGTEAVASDLKTRIDLLERTFEEKMQALNALLS